MRVELSVSAGATTVEAPVSAGLTYVPPVIVAVDVAVPLITEDEYMNVPVNVALLNIPPVASPR